MVYILTNHLISQNLKKELSDQKILVYEVEDKNLWEGCFEKDNKGLEDKIFDVCKKEINRWLSDMKYRANR